MLNNSKFHYSLIEKQNDKNDIKNDLKQCMLKIVKALAFMAFKCFIEKLQKYPIPMRHCITLTSM